MRRERGVSAARERRQCSMAWEGRQRGVGAASARRERGVIAARERRLAA